MIYLVMSLKKNIILIIISIALGIATTFFILNKENIYAKEEYSIYAFQIGAYSSYDNALNTQNKYPSIILKDDNLYKVYVALYEDADIINNMLQFFQDKGYDVYLKMLKVNKDFYNKLLKYEELVKKTKDNKLYEEINKSILNLYLESIDDNL